VGTLTRAFPPGLVDRVVATDARERRRLLPARQRRRTGCRAGYRLRESPPVSYGTNLDEELRSCHVQGTHPILGTRDIQRAIVFYTRQLGFELAFGDKADPPNYVGFRRDAVELHMQFQFEDEMGRSVCASW